TATTLSFPPTLDNTSRKFIHEAVKRLGLRSKSKGKGDQRFITVFKKSERGNGDGTSGGKLPPELFLGQEREELLRVYFDRQPATSSELNFVMGLALDGGMNTASWLALQKKHKAARQERQARAAATGAGSSKKNLWWRAQSYRAAQDRRRASPTWATMSVFRAGLPAWGYRERIMNMVRDHQACLISGETGCGKSTQVPQFLLDDVGERPEVKTGEGAGTRTGSMSALGPACKIVCTQPRRISAIAVAERIAEERGERIGTKVGYTIRLESSTSRETQLVLMTPGILLKKLLVDPMLMEFTHVIIDEVHERDRNSEFLLIVLKSILPQRPDLRVVLMSATLQQGKYASYFGGCPITTIGDRTFPVQTFFLEDVLLQTRYLEEIGADGGGGVGAINNGSLGEGGCAGDTSFVCMLCGKSSFRSAEELGTHLAICFGVEGMDPALEGLSQGGLDLLLKGVRGGDGQEEKNRVLGSDSDDQSSGLGALQSKGCLEEVSTGSAGDASTSSEMWVDGENKAGEGEREVGEEEEDDNEEDALAEEDDMQRGLHDALAQTQKWDGKGTFRGERVGTGKRAEELLQRYQFAFDDEMVDYELIECLLRYLCHSAYEEGAVLVFLPGWDDISRLGDLLQSSKTFSDTRKFSVLPLHSGIPTGRQREVFARPPSGCRKIVLATNIAETSITINDVAFVIDSGRVKEANYDPHLKLKTLVPQWVSKASARQRRGRAGRTKAGVCFHLFSSRRHEALKDHQESELLRTPLEEIVLQAKMLGLADGKPGEANSVASFLSQAIDPPPDLSLQNAVQLLESLGALDEDEDLTDLGTRLAGMSLDPRVGKMVLWSYLLGCAGPSVSVACAMTYKDPFVLPMNSSQRQEAKQAKLSLAQGTESDLIALLQALERHTEATSAGGQAAAGALAKRAYLSASTLGMITDICGQVARELKGFGLPHPYEGRSSNVNSKDVSLLSSVLCAGLYPNVACRKPGASNFHTLGGYTARV
ncbi:unnamed protein product, partial [Choristocarpus tenellus]